MTPDLLAPLARIILRYLAGYFAARSAAHAALLEPDMASLLSLGLSILCTVVSEVWYWFARKRGWRC